MATKRGDTPKYQEIAAKLRAQIAAGDLLPGALLPPEPTIATHHNVHVATVRQALGQLRMEGLVVTAPGRGSFIRPSTTTSTLRVEDYLHAVDVAQGAAMPPSQIPGLNLTFAYEPSREVSADAELADAFGVTEGTTLWRREAVGSYFDSPRWIITSYLLLDVVRGTQLAEPDYRWPASRTSIGPELLSIGIEPTQFVERYRGRMPTAEEIDRLQVVMVDPLLVSRRRVFAGDRVVEVGLNIAYHGSQVEVECRVDAPRGRTLS